MGYETVLEAGVAIEASEWEEEESEAGSDVRPTRGSSDANLADRKCSIRSD